MSEASDIHAAHLSELRELAIEALDRWEEHAHAVAANPGNAFPVRDLARLDLLTIADIRETLKP